ncbi:MAG: hypothetical protein ACI9A2_003014 [Halioglobus sp.]|jgi:hypothetical protein
MLIRSLYPCEALFQLLRQLVHLTRQGWDHTVCLFALDFNHKLKAGLPFTDSGNLAVLRSANESAFQCVHARFDVRNIFDSLNM